MNLLKRIVAVTALAVFMGLSLVALAQAGNVGGGAIQNPLTGVDTFADLIVNVTNFLLGLVGILSLVGIVYGGIRMIISIGNESGLAEAKRIVFWSVAGLAVAGLAYTIISIVASDLLGISQVNESRFIAPAYAATDIGLDEAERVNLPRLSATTLGQNIVNLLTSLAAVIALAAFIWGAVMYITSLGDDSKAGTAKKIMLYAVIGLLLVGAAYVVLRVVQQILGI